MTQKRFSLPWCVSLGSAFRVPADRPRRGLRGESVAGEDTLLPRVLSRSESREGRLGGYRREDFNTRKALKVCSIKRVELGNAVAQHRSGELGIEDMTANDAVFVKKRGPTVNRIQWHGQECQAGEGSNLLYFG